MPVILIVDDEKSIRMTLGAFLEDDGYRVLVAEDGDAALSVLDSRPVDVVVTDIILPGVSGVELLEKIRERHPDVVVVMMTGEPTLESASRSLRHGAFDYLFKPVDKSAILRAVSRAWRLKEVSDEKKRLMDENLRYQSLLERMVAKRTRYLKESEVRYRQLVQYLPSGVAVILDGKVVFSNASMNEIFLLMGVAGDPKAQGEALNRILAGATGEDAAFQTHHESVVPLGEGRTLILDLVTLPFSIRRKPAFQVIARDITRQRQMDATLRQSQKMEAVGVLAGGIAHDFNNILSAIIGYAELAAEDAEAGTLLSSNIREVISAGKRAKDLVRQILAFSRQSEQEHRTLRLQPIVSETIKLIRGAFPSLIDIRPEVSESCPPISGDPTQVHQALMNLCTNAYHAMRDTGGIMGVRLYETASLPEDYSGPLTPKSSGPFVCLEVSDTGHGIDSSVLNRIFDPYFTTKPVGEGTGLGLSMVHGIVGYHGGAISVDTEAGIGTLFQLYFPVFHAAEENTDSALADLAPKKGIERILFIDDEEAIVRLARQMLSRLGYAVTVFQDSEAALAFFFRAPENIDLVITDYTMPRKTGMDVARAILARSPGFPVVLCTGHSENVSLEEAEAIGIRAMITKPITTWELAETIRAVLDTSGSS